MTVLLIQFYKIFYEKNYKIFQWNQPLYLHRLPRQFGVGLSMGTLTELLKKAPQSIKDKYKIKIREKAIERVKEKIIKHNKKLEDYSDDEMEAMIAEAESGLNEDVRTGLLTALLVGAGIEIVAGG